MDHLAEISIERIIINKNVRNVYDQKNLHELAESIRNSGLRNPIEVRDLNNTYYEVITGHRRFKSFQYLYQLEPERFSRVPCIVRRNYNDATLEIDQLIENLQRENLNPLDECGTIKNIIEQHNFTYKEVAEKIGKTESFVQKSQLYLFMLEKIEKCVDEELFKKCINLPKTKIIELKQLKDDTKLEAIVKKIINEDLSAKAIRELVNDTNLKDPNSTKVVQKNLVDIKENKGVIQVKINIAKFPEELKTYILNYLNELKETVESSIPNEPVNETIAEGQISEAGTEEEYDEVNDSIAINQ